jgi:hypothetical protein
VSYEIAKRLNKLLYCPSITPLLGEFNDVKLDGKFHITNLLTVFYPLVNTKAGEEFLKKVDDVTDEMIIWESGDEPQKEIEYILNHTSFTVYEKITETYGTGKVRELGAFRKISS